MLGFLIIGILLCIVGVIPGNMDIRIAASVIGVAMIIWSIIGTMLENKYHEKV